MKRPFIEIADCPAFNNVADIYSLTKDETTEQSKLFKAEASAQNVTDNVKEIIMDSHKWLPFAAEHYNISPNIKDYVMQPFIIMTSDLPNRNCVAFPHHQLASFCPDSGSMVFQTWKGKPTFEEHCFPGDTLITMGDFSTKPIKDVQVGEEVYSPLGTNKVTQVFNNGVKSVAVVTAKAGNKEFTIKATKNHPFMAATLESTEGVVEQDDWDFDWVPLERLKPGDFLIYSIPVTVLEIVSIVYNTEECEVFNLEVEDVHCYTANGFLVHNCNKDITKAKGLIFDSVYRPLSKAHGNLWKVVCLCAFDRTKDPYLVNEILSGRRKSGSMGAYCSDYKCNICGSMHTKGGCDHVRLGRPKFKLFDGRLAYLQAVNPLGFEVSSVKTPAYWSCITDKQITI